MEGVTNRDPSSEHTQSSSLLFLSFINNMESEGLNTPQSLVTDEQVKKILLLDKGSDAQLVSWSLDNFTKMGDNYATTVIGIEVKYIANDETLEAFYVAKLNPQRASGPYNEMTHDLFIKESDFYSTFLPELNEVMKSVGQPPLNFPKYFHHCLERKNEQIYFEDLRKKGFKMFDRKKGMDVPHATLVLRELARLHAASLLLQEKRGEPLEVNYKSLLNDLFSSSVFSKDFIYPMINANLDHSIMMLEQFGGYEKVITWVEGLRPQIEEIFSTHMKTEGYNVLCHGDCWNNNVLFRYDSSGCPLEVILVDLQICRKASLATDLNYFMYASLTSDIRRPNLNSLLNSYHKYFNEVTEAGGMVMPFSEVELLTEFRSKNKLGAMFGMMCIPMLLMEPEEVPDIKEWEGDFGLLMNEMNKKAMAMMNTHPLLKPRFLATFDEFIETGLIS